MTNKKMLCLSAISAFCAFSQVATAASSHIDLYYVDAEVEPQVGASANGDGVGVKGRLALGESKGYFGFEYQRSVLDAANQELGYFRFGFGASRPLSSGVDFLLGAEFIHTDLGEQGHGGVGITAGVEAALSPSVRGFVSLGYADLGVGDGATALIGGRYSLTKRLSLFADYRVHDLSDDGNQDLAFSEVRLGLGFRLGSASIAAPAATAPAPAPVAAAKPMPAPAPAPKAPAEPMDPLDGVTTAVFGWARAWSAQDVEGYLSAYAPEFVPSKGLSRTAWVKQRRQRVSAPERISVEVIDPKAESTGANTARVRFKQVYESNTYSDSTNKVLELKKVAGRWLIVRETSR